MCFMIHLESIEEEEDDDDDDDDEDEMDMDEEPESAHDQLTNFLKQLQSNYWTMTSVLNNSCS